MAYEQKDNSGSLFKNDKKETDNHPDYTGSALVGGQEVWMSAWLKTASNGKSSCLLASSPKTNRPPSQLLRQPLTSLMKICRSDWERDARTTFHRVAGYPRG